jgi:hypothetical protein
MPLTPQQFFKYLRRFEDRTEPVDVLVEVHLVYPVARMGRGNVHQILHVALALGHVEHQCAAGKVERLFVQFVSNELAVLQQAAKVALAPKVAGEP